MASKLNELTSGGAVQSGDSGYVVRGGVDYAVAFGGMAGKDTGGFLSALPTASQIALADTGVNFVAKNVEDALKEWREDTGTYLQTAGEVPVADTGAALTATNVEDALHELADGSVFPTGTVVPYAGTTAPAGFLLCFGQNVSRTTYAALFAIISTTYGVGDGSTTFGLPDLRGRVVAGQDDMGGTSANRLTDAVSQSLDGDVLGDAGGEETHQITVAELAAHDHDLEWDGTGGTTYGATNYRSKGSATDWNASGGNVNTVMVKSVGSNTAHNNVQPTIILNYIIKT